MTNNSCWSNGWISSDFSARSIKTSSIRQESITWYLSWAWLERGKNLEWRYSDCGLERKVGCISNLSSKNQHQRSIDNTEEEMNSFPQWQMVQQKLSGRDCEFREPTKRREQTVRRENLTGKVQGEPEGPQPTESTDDAEAREDFWSIHGDFISHHHIEPRVHLCAERRNIPCSTEIHWCDLGYFIQIWTCCKKNVLTIVGMWTRTEVYQILGKDLQSSAFWKRNLQMDICGPGGD